MNKYELCVLIATLINLATSQRTYLEGYYWRDYEGIIPTDALPGGTDKNGKFIYIGQALHKSLLIPGKIYDNDIKIYYEWNQKEFTATANVKVLCTPYPEKFEWISTKHNEVITLTNKLLIKGGYQKSFSTYIGRAFASGETSIGKVICQETDCLGLYTSKDGKIAKHRNAFEVLIYNPKINANTDIDKCNPRIDPRYQSF